MTQQFRFRQFPAGNPLANFLVVLAGILVISLALTVGFFVFLAIVGFMLIAGAVIGIRGWWQRYRRRGSPPAADEPPTRETHRIRVIEGEYHEVRRDERR